MKHDINDTDVVTYVTTDFLAGFQFSCEICNCGDTPEKNKYLKVTLGQKL